MIKDVWGNTKSRQGYPDLLVHYEDKEMIIEFERTRKSKDKFKLKLINIRQWLVDGGKIHWITNSQTLANWIENQINTIEAYPKQHSYEILT